MNTRQLLALVFVAIGALLIWDGLRGASTEWYRVIAGALFVLSGVLQWMRAPGRTVVKDNDQLPPGGPG